MSSLWERPVVLQCVDLRRTVLDSEFSALCIAYFVLQEAPVDMFLLVHVQFPHIMYHRMFGYIILM